MRGSLTLVDGARRGHVAVAATEHVDAAIGARPTLTTEQVAMIRQVCESGHGVDVIEGVAGAGKTYALAAAREAWTASGFRVHGVCLAARAAQRLEEGSGIASMTLDRLLRGLDYQTLTATDIITVDEAGMIGTRKLLVLLEHAMSARAKVVLVGDPRQLPEIEAGGAFSGLLRRHGRSELVDNRRQHAEWERAALAELRHGDPVVALDAYEAHDRIHVASRVADIRDTLIAEWHNARSRGRDALMVAANLRAVDDLNDRARHVLQTTGDLGPDRIQLGLRRYSEGDHILALRNDYELGILNGTRGTIVRIDTQDQLLQIITDDQRWLTVPFHYAAGDLTHGYATTIHKAQGATVDRCFVLVEDSTSREHAYTSLSRGREGNDLYIAIHDTRAEECHGPELDPDTTERLRSSISRSISDILAIDQTPRADGQEQTPELDRSRGLEWDLPPLP